MRRLLFKLPLIPGSLCVWRFSSFLSNCEKEQNSPTALPWEHAENKMPEARVPPWSRSGWGENVLMQLMKKHTKRSRPPPRRIRGLVLERLVIPCGRGRTARAPWTQLTSPVTRPAPSLHEPGGGAGQSEGGFVLHPTGHLTYKR